MSLPPPPILCADNILHHPVSAPGFTLDLRGSSLSVDPGSFTRLSGAGAPHLLRLLGLLDRPDSGEVWFASQSAGSLDEPARLELRNRSFGFMFAEPFLLQSFTVAENIAMALFKLSGLDIESAHQRTAEMLDFVGLRDASECPITELDPCEQHKVSLARALSNAPRVLIVEDAGADLPPAQRAAFLSLLPAARDLFGAAVIAHLSSSAGLTFPGREILMDAGAIVSDTRFIPAHEAPAHE